MFSPPFSNFLLLLFPLFFLFLLFLFFFLREKETEKDVRKKELRTIWRFTKKNIWLPHVLRWSSEFLTILNLLGRLVWIDMFNLLDICIIVLLLEIWKDSIEKEIVECERNRLVIGLKPNQRKGIQRWKRIIPVKVG